MLSGLKNFDNNQKLVVIGLIPSFGKDDFSQKKLY